MENQIRKKSFKKFLLGHRGEAGFIGKFFMYLLLIGISFIFLYPILKMLAISFMGLEDLIDPSVIWIPSKIVGNNYEKASEVLNFWKSLGDSLKVGIFPTLCAVISSSLIGYGFAHFEFPLKKLWMALLIAVFLLPTLLMSIPTYVIYSKLNMLGSLKSYIYPALTGFGLRQSVFILIFYQFFKVIPKELSESAEMDGASEIGIFFRIAVPMSIPAFIICMLYSFVWYWNETVLATSYFKGNINTLQMALSNFEYIYRQTYGGGSIGIGAAAESFNQGVLFAGTILTILPLILLYAFTQKWFVESADRSGIAGD